LSVLARHNGVPFYVAAPSSTFDLSIKSGDQIDIEERPGREITSLGQTKLAPDGISVYNPAFDVTNAADITAIITETGIIKKPNAEEISRHLAR
jgi:methylthioribose-1-phosphate isomerase